MIKIVKSGRDKVFYERCPYCATEFEYEAEDTNGIYENDMQLARIVQCPECGNEVNACLLEKEEYRKGYTYNGYVHTKWTV